MLKRRSALALAICATIGLSAHTAHADAPKVRIGMIDPFSGPLAEEGRNGLLHLTFAAEKANAKYGTNIEIVPLDNALSVETSLQRLRQANDEGISFITAGFGSSYVQALIAEIGKNNARNPDRRMVLLNHSGAAMAFTEELCSFYHFRFDANVGMMAAGMVTAMGRNPNLTKVYMQNMDYSYGQSFAAASRKFLAERAPKIQIVGDELIPPFGRIQDFTPYVSKIKSSEANVVLSSSFGPDLNRLVLAGLGAGLNVDWYMRSSYNGSSLPVFGRAGAGKIYAVFENNINDEAPDFLAAWFKEYQARNDGRSWAWDRMRMMIDMLAQAIVKTKSTDPVAIAKALEGMTVPGQYGTVQMRPEDHQIQMAMSVGRTTTNFKLEQDKSGVGFETSARLTREEVSLPTTCKMSDRPK
jgi:branched-chain amino acid transport system substrate-binding protein